VYAQGGAGVGSDVGPQGQLGGSSNRYAFTGPSVEAAASLVGGVSVSTNESGKTAAITIGAKGSPLAAHVANTTTKAFTLFDLFDAAVALKDKGKGQVKQFLKEGRDAVNHANGIQ
jgi:hypothetical protein